MSIAFSVVIALHGLIHALGALKWWMGARVPGLSGRTLLHLSDPARRIFGLLWLVALGLLLAAAALRVADREIWWGFALAGLLTSQALAIAAWPDAKAGTAVNLILLVPTAIAAAHASFEHRVAAEVRELLAQPSPSPSELVRAAELEPLPAPVRRWLEGSGVVGRERAHSARLQQRGFLRTAPDKAWMPTRAEQYFSIDRPGFVWRVDATMLQILPIAGRDRYFEGRGQMLIKAGSLLTVVAEGDEHIASGAMLRFVGEMIWFPSAALSPYLHWDAIDDAHARVTMRDAGREVSAEYAFDASGRVTGLRAERYLGGGPDAKLTPWHAHCDTWSDVRGVQVPLHGEVSWTLPSGDFCYYRWWIVDLELNRPELYGASDRRSELEH